MPKKIKEFCENCKYFDRYWCKRRAPLGVLKEEGEGGYMKSVIACWPDVRESNWCGEWEKKK